MTVKGVQSYFGWFLMILRMTDCNSSMAFPKRKQMFLQIKLTFSNEKEALWSSVNARHCMFQNENNINMDVASSADEAPKAKVFKILVLLTLSFFSFLIALVLKAFA